MVVTQAAIDDDLLPASGTVTLDTTPTRTLRIVGVAQAHGSWAAPLRGLIARDTLGEPVDPYATDYHLYRDRPFTWTDVKAANTFGLMVLSADVLRNPPPRSEIDPELTEMMSLDAGRTAGLVSPVAAAADYRDPARRARLRRQGRAAATYARAGGQQWSHHGPTAAHGVVPGGGARCARGGRRCSRRVLAVPVVTRWVIPIWTPWAGGPLDVPWVQVGAVMAVAILSALLPARRLGRLDIVGVMKGQEVSPSPSKLVFLAGVIAAVLGGLVLFLGIVGNASEIVIVAGAVPLIVGALFTVPILLPLAARGSQHLPVAMRLASRDAARQRARSTPSVAAIVGAVAALTMMGVGLTSDTEQARREYVPSAPYGEANISLPFSTDVRPRNAPAMPSRARRQASSWCR